MKYGRLLLAIAIIFTMSSCTRVANQLFQLEPLEYRVEAERDVMVPMSDGVRLATDIYHPRGLSQSPVILIRTPYNKHPEKVLDQLNVVIARLLTRHGYTVIVQDCRGRYGSEGEFYPFIAEFEDGRDALAWAATQEWSTGKVGSWGGSYFGFTQWAMAENEELDAMAPYVTGAEIQEIVYEGGALNFSNMLGWGAGNRDEQGVSIPIENLERGLNHLPLIDSDLMVVDADISFYNDAVSYNMPDGWSDISYQDRYDDVVAPALSIAGWYDLFQKSQIEDMMKIREVAKEPARSTSRIIIGPWGHGIFEKSPVKFKDGGILSLGQLNKLLDWYDALLKGEDTGVEDWPVYYVYVMGSDEWVGLDVWPPAEMQPTPYYFHSSGRANTADGDGRLATEPGSAGGTDMFVYDPAHPVPTTGGPLLGADLGPKKQGLVEEREDVLVYTSDPLTEPLTLMGPISLTLYAETDALDTDFTAKLCDVFPNGMSINITDGIIRARFRDGDILQPELIEPGKVYEYEIDLWHTAYTFKPGHRVRVQVSSSNFPRFDRNLNTGGDIATGTNMQPAQQTIYHDSKRPSHITLPVVR